MSLLYQVPIGHRNSVHREGHTLLVPYPYIGPRPYMMMYKLAYEYLGPYVMIGMQY